MVVFQCFWIIIMRETMSCKRLYPFECKQCKMITFVDFKHLANEKSVVFLKERQTLIKVRRKLYEEKIKWEEKKRTSNAITRVNFD